MPRVSYGPEAKRRATKLLGLILAFANDGIEGDEGALDLLRSQVKVHWQGDRQLVVRTTVRALVALAKVEAVGLSGEQVKEGLRRLGDFVGVLEDNRSSGSGSETWHFTLRLWFGRWEEVENVEKMEAVWEERRSGEGPRIGPLAPKFGGTGVMVEQVEDEQDDRWLNYCRNSLVAQNVGRSTSNPLTLRDGIAFDWADLYVPLGIVARDEEEAIEIDPETFLTRLIEHGGRSAIVGEPGTGKTTLLQKLAWGLLAAGKLPVWMSLADLQGQGLEAYLLGEWLRLATGEFVVAEALAGELAARFKAGQVWLILDAVDEMGIEGSLARSFLARQLRGWLGAAPVVLSCRSQVWDAGQNRLEGFSCYRNVDFVGQQDAFVRRWFGADRDQAEGLLARLAQRSNIRDLVQNPLCLALLCRTWAVNQGVATTRSHLYRQFVRALFDWKQDVMPTDLGQRLRLSQGLGRVAIAAIKEGRFRLSQGFLQQVWGGDFADLLPSALQLGWLKATQAGESVYAFYHPTFQEYFAAQAISDWEETFGGDYLWEILQPQWREVVGFWFGRSEVSTVAKEALLKQLVNFDDRAGGFYRYRAHFLAATGLAEFPESFRARAIAARVVRWRFGWCDGGQWRETSSVVRAATQAVMGWSDRAIMTEALERYLTQLRGQSMGRKSTFFALWNSAYSLGKQYAPGHQGAIEVLRELLESVESPYFRVQLCNNLVKVNPGDEVAIGVLREMMNGADLKMQRRSAHCLAMIDSEDEEAIAKLKKLAMHGDKDVQKMAIASLDQLAGKEQVLRQRLVREKSAAVVAREIGALEKKIKEAQNPGALLQAAGRLGRLVPGHGGAIEVLIALLERDGLEGSFYRRVGDTLEAVMTGERYGLVVGRLYALRGEDARGNLCDRLLWGVTREVGYGVFLAWVEIYQASGRSIN
jgi:Effector-associated domain 4/NACHT domain